MRPKEKIHELLQYRNMIRSLITKGLFGKYRHSYIGFGWHFLTPLLYIVLCYLLYTELRERSIEDFWLFVASGVFCFHMLTASVVGGSTCFTSNVGTIKKMYFPKEILTISRTITNLIVLCIGYIIVILLILITGHSLGWPILLLPIELVFLVIFSIGSMLLFSTIAVYIRDIIYALSALRLVFFICTPLRYPVSSVSGLMESIIWLNPFTYYVEVFKSVLYYNSYPDWNIFFTGGIISIIVLIIGCLTYSRLKKGIVKRL